MLPAAAPSPAAAVNCPAQPPGVDCPSVTGAVVGYIGIYENATLGMPLDYAVTGALADPTSFSCSAATLAGGAFRVTCTPLPNVVVDDWRCDVLHADATTSTAGARVRTALDCDGSAPAEAQTDVVAGQGDHDSVWSPSNVGVTEFSCTVDDGSGGAPSPDFVAGCGDPGLVTVDAG